MKGPAYVAILAVVIGTVCAQDNPDLTVKWKQPGTLDVRIGDPLTVTCDVNQPFDFLRKNDVDIVLKSAGEEFVLEQGLRIIGTELKPYRLHIEVVQEEVAMEMYVIIDNVTDLFDGKLICRAKTQFDQGGTILAEAYLDIVILRPLDVLRLKLDAAEPITESKTDPVELDSGYHSVTCVAEGSNPAASVKLYLDGEDVSGVETKSEKMETDLTKFRTTLKTSVHIFSQQHKLECNAQTQFGDSSVQLPIKIKPYNPEIVCTDSEAYEGQKDVVISCTVDYTYLEITSFIYSFGGEEFNSEGDHNDEFVQVSKQQLTDTKVSVQLKIKVVHDWHFQTEFYLLVVHRDGFISRESFMLRRMLPGGDQPSIFDPIPLLSLLITGIVAAVVVVLH